MEARRKMISRPSADRFGDAAGHHVSPCRDNLLPQSEQIRKHRETRRRMPEHGRAGAERHPFAVFLDDDTQGTKIEILHVARGSAHHVARRRGIVGDHAGQIELEIRIARIDDLECRHGEVDRRQGARDGTAGAPQFAAGDEGNFRLDPGMDELRSRQFRVGGYAVIVQQKAIDRRSHSHLLHFGTRSQAHLQAG